MTIKELEELIMAQAKEKGFGTKPEDIYVPEKIALIHSEVSEAFEAYRKNKLEGDDCFKEELADIVFRTIHLCGILGIDLEQEIVAKVKRNAGREWDWSGMNEKSPEK